MIHVNAWTCTGVDSHSFIVIWGATSWRAWARRTPVVFYKAVEELYHLINLEASLTAL